MGAGNYKAESRVAIALTIGALVLGLLLLAMFVGGPEPKQAPREAPRLRETVKASETSEEETPSDRIAIDSEEAGRRVRLRIDARTSFDLDAKRTPNVSFVVGVGRDGGKGRATPYVDAARLFEPREVDRIRTDARGRADLDMYLAPGDSAELVWLRVDSTQHVAALTVAKLRENAELLHLTVVAAPGNIYAGRVVDSAGRPVPEASVTAHARIEKRWQELSDRARTDENGEFECIAQLRDAAAAPQIHLIASKPLVGSRTLQFPNTHENHDDLAIELISYGTITGQVFDGSGGTVAGLEVRASASEVGFLSRGRRAVAKREGLLHTRTTTDEQGYFRFDGLARGDFLLQGHLIPQERDELLFPDPVPAGSMNVRCLLDFPRLEVLAFDAGGHPLELSRPAGFEVGVGLDHPRVLVIDAGEITGESVQADKGTELLGEEYRVAPHHVGYGIQPGHEYFVALLSERHEPVYRRVLATAGRTEVRLTALPEVGAADLQITLSGPPSLEYYDTTVQVFATDLPLPLVDSESRLMRSGIRRVDVRLPPGEYAVVAYAGALPVGDSFAVSEVVVLSSARRTRVELELPQFGLLELEVDGKGDVPMTADAINANGDRFPIPWEARALGCVNMSEFITPKDLKPPPYLPSTLAAPLPPGDYTIVLRDLEQGAEWKTGVTIQNGETTHATLAIR